MKLLKKTNRTFFIISASAFIVAGVIIYIVLSIIFKAQLNENLQSDMSDIIMDIEKGKAIPNYFPFVEIRTVPGQNDRSSITIDTLIFDDTEKENIPYRQISSVVSIKDQVYNIVVRDTLLEKSDLLLSIGIVIGFVFILLNISLYYINRKASIKIWKPFYDALDNIRGFSPDNIEFNLSAKSEIDEFIELNETLDNLTKRVISEYQSLKRFTEDASHEIQSPLAVIQSKLETLMQHQDLKKDHADLINSAYTAVQRISKLTQTLLLLTKIVNKQFPEKRLVNLSELIEEKMDFFEYQLNRKSLNLQRKIEPDHFLETDLFLAESMVMNLIGNAVKHSSEGGNIGIRLDKSSFEISNSGTPLNVPPSKLFERFFKINKSSESQGLGLAIVKEICSLYNWEISYEYLDDQHKFTVRF